jgi:5'-3' exonuclease
VLGAATTRTLAEPGARAVWELNCAAMAMVDDAALGLDLERGVGCLPLREDAVRATFASLELHVPSAVRALTGRETSAPRPVDVDASWQPSARRSTMRHPPLPKPRARSEPAYVQETLF